MTGLTDTDIRLDDDGQLTQGADGDAPLCSGADCLYQSIVLEATTQKGDLFYDLDWGWSLFDFVKSEDDDLARLEITQRAQTGLQSRDAIDPDSIEVSVDYSNDAFRLYCSFRFTDETETRDLTVVIDSISVEVVSSGN